MKKSMIALVAMAFIFAVVAPALAEVPAGPAAQEQKSATQNLRQEIVKLKYVRAQDIQSYYIPFSALAGLSGSTTTCRWSCTVSDSFGKCR